MNQEIQPLFEVDAMKVAVGSTPDPEVAALPKRRQFLAAYKRRIMRDGKGGKDRITMLPDRLVEPLKTHLDKAAVLHKKDLSEGFGVVYRPSH